MHADDLYELISDRAVNVFPNPVVAAESLLDRLINTSHQILMDGPATDPENDLALPRQWTTPSRPGRPTPRPIGGGIA